MAIFGFNHLIYNGIKIIYQMLKAIKIRLYLSTEQEIYINKLLGSYRFIYNQCLDFKIKKYNNHKETATFKDLGKHLTSLKNEFEWLRESHSKVLQQSLINLEQAYKSFFKNGNGFPKFKSKHQKKQSCRFPVDAIMGVKGNRINITRKLNDIHFKCSKRDERELNKYQDKIKSGTLSKTKSGKYYFSILIDTKIKKELPDTDKIIGIDLGIKDFIVDSNGEKFENIKVIRNNKTKLAKLHRELSRKQKNSSNKNKARIKLAKFHEKLNNIKENYLHKVVNQLLSENQTIVMEDLNIKGMMKNHCLARSIQELSLYRFKEMLVYKAKWYNRDIIQVDKFFPSSKKCSCCGEKNINLTLSDRHWKCQFCGCEHDRDFNAATNLRNEGLRILGLSSSLMPLEG